jgi:hypothetical protein
VHHKGFRKGFLLLCAKLESIENVGYDLYRMTANVIQSRHWNGCHRDKKTLSVQIKGGKSNRTDDDDDDDDVNCRVLVVSSELWE